MEEHKTTVRIEVYDPSGTIEVVATHASRIAELNGKTIGMLSNHMWEDFRVLPAIAKELQLRFPTVKIIPYTELPGVYGTDPDAVAKLVAEKGCDAVIVGNAA